MSNTMSMSKYADVSLEKLREICALQAQQIEALTAQVRRLEELLRLATHNRFGASSERKPVAEYQQEMLFNEAEALAAPDQPESDIEVVSHKRRKQKGHREAELSGLPVETIEYRLSDEERVCECCGGFMHEMGSEVRREVKVVPASAILVEHMQFKYACRACELTEISTPMAIAPMPAPPIPGSWASASLVAYVLFCKFVMGLPLYRQEQHSHSLGVTLPRQSMANWVMACSDRWLSKLYDRLHSILLARDHLHADETELQVLHEPGRAATARSYMWLYRTGRDGPPIVLFDYRPSRARENPAQFLAGFSGYLQADGYVGYEKLPGVTVVGCWAHARRGFTDALKGMPKVVVPSTPILAETGLAFCNKLFAIEESLKAECPDDRRQHRLERSQPVLDTFRKWLEASITEVLPKGKSGGAIAYCLNQWPKLVVFLEDGRLELDNNRAERSIKSLVIGRKNWLFANVPRGATSSAIAYSIVETAKENGLSTFDYLTYLLEQLPNIDQTDPAALDALLPWSPTLPESCKLPAKAKR